MRGHRRKRRQDVREFTFRPQKLKFNRRKITRQILNWFVLVLVAAIFGYAVITFAVQTVQVVGPSMGDTLKEGQTVIVNKLIYTFDDVERYDIIAYSQVESDDYYDIKRVVGLPGETIVINNGKLYVDGIALEEEYFDKNILSAGVASKEIILGKDEYFVLGDNVNNSEDSRYTNVGNISSSEILGKVVYIIGPKEDRGKVK